MRFQISKCKSQVSPSSQSPAVKEFLCHAGRICRQFFVKFLAATSPGKLKEEHWRRTFRQTFFTTYVGEKFGQNFALGALAKCKIASFPEDSSVLKILRAGVHSSLVLP